MDKTKLAALTRRGNRKSLTIRFDNNHAAGVVFNAHITDHMDAAETTATYAVVAGSAVSPSTPGRDISRFYRTIVIQAPALHPAIQPQVSIDGTNWVSVPVGWTNQGMDQNANTLLATDVAEILAVTLPSVGIRLRLSTTVPEVQDPADGQDDFIISVMLTDSSERADIGRA